jgi:hypothetical protein
MRVTTIFLAILLSIGTAQAITLYAVDNNTLTGLNATFSITYNQYTQYQEFANANSSPAQNTSGTYYEQPGDASGNPKSLFINYSKSPLYINFTWMVKTGNGTGTIRNLTNAACFGALSDRVNFQESSIDAGTATPLISNTTLYCYNGTANVTMFSEAGLNGSIGGGYTGNYSYDGDYGTKYKYAGFSRSWTTNTTGYSADNSSVAWLWEEGVWWGINSSTETASAPTGSVVPAGQVNYTNGSSGQITWGASSFNVTVSAPGYSTQSLNSVSLNLSNYTFNLTRASNTTFILRDEVTGNIINTTTTSVRLSSSIYGANGSTTNGTINFANLTYDYYTVTYNGTNYTQRQLYAYLPSGSNSNYTLYLLSDTSSTLVLFTVLDQTYSVLNGVVVTALKKNLSGTNYYSVAQCTTDLNGECLMNLELYVSTYRFITEYNSVVRNSSDTVLSRNTYTIVLNTATSTLQDVLNRNDIAASLVYTPTGRFDYTVVDSNGGVQSGLMTIERRYGGRLYSVSSTTGSGSSFIITATGVNTSLGDEILANGYVYIDGQPVLTHSISVINSAAGGSLGNGLAFLFLGMLFTIVFIFAWNPVAPLIAFGAFVLIMSRIGIIGLGSGAVVAVLVVIAVAIYRMRSV